MPQGRKTTVPSSWTHPSCHFSETLLTREPFWWGGGEYPKPQPSRILCCLAWVCLCRRGLAEVRCDTVWTKAQICHTIAKRWPKKKERKDMPEKSKKQIIIKQDDVGVSSAHKLIFHAYDRNIHRWTWTDCVCVPNALSPQISTVIQFMASSTQRWPLTPSAVTWKLSPFRAAISWLHKGGGGTERH